MLKNLNSDREIPNSKREIPMKKFQIPIEKFQILIESKISIYFLTSTKEE